MVSLLGECGFKPNTPFMEFPSCFIKVLYAMSSKESIVFISFYKKIWPYNGAITALWQNQIIVIVCSIFLTCLNKVQCFVNGGFYPQQRLINFEKNIKNRYFLCHVFPLHLLTYLLPVVTVEMKISKSFLEVSILHYVHQIGYICIVISHKCFWIAEWLYSSFLMCPVLHVDSDLRSNFFSP